MQSRGNFYFGGVNGGDGPQEGKWPRKVVVNSNFTVTRMFADLSDTEREIILDPNVRIVNLETAEQPEIFDLTPDENSDDDEADIRKFRKFLSGNMNT